MIKKGIIFGILLVVIFFSWTNSEARRGELLGQSISIYMTTDGKLFITIYADYDLRAGNESTSLYVEVVRDTLIKKLKEIGFRFPRRDLTEKLEMPYHYPTEIGIFQKGRDVKVVVTRLINAKPTYHSESMDITEIELNESKNEPENLAEELIHKAFGCPPSH